jgi:hypothetical protein
VSAVAYAASLGPVVEMEAIVVLALGAAGIACLVAAGLAWFASRASARGAWLVATLLGAWFGAGVASLQVVGVRAPLDLAFFPAGIVFALWEARVLVGAALGAAVVLLVWLAAGPEVSRASAAR